MRSRRALVAIGFILMSPACSEGSGGTGTGGAGGGAACEAEESELSRYIEDSRSCAADEDCQALEVDCLFEGRARGECSGRFFVSIDIDADRLAALNEQLRACLPNPTEVCGGCLMATFEPACVDQVCGPGEEITYE